MLDYILSFITMDHSVAAGVGLVSAPAVAWVKNKIVATVSFAKSLISAAKALEAKVAADAAALKKVVADVQAPAALNVPAPATPAHIGG